MKVGCLSIAHQNRETKCVCCFMRRRSCRGEQLCEVELSLFPSNPPEASGKEGAEGLMKCALSVAPVDYFGVHDRVLHVHHVNGNHSDDREVNRLLVCGECHAMIHGAFYGAIERGLFLPTRNMRRQLLWVLRHFGKQTDAVVWG